MSSARRRVRLFFFFQAEDGIRDIGVTGVQTCALPICAGNDVVLTAVEDAPSLGGLTLSKSYITDGGTDVLTVTVTPPDPSQVDGVEFWLRSEERRVGKEGRYRWSPYDDKRTEEVEARR